MSEEIKNVVEEPQVNEAPVQKEEPKKARLNASVAPEEFDWDAFENDTVAGENREEVAALYDQTLQKVTARWSRVSSPRSTSARSS